jgi:hypothetical protein
MPSLAATPMFVTSAGINSNPLVTPSFTPGPGEVLVIKTATSDVTVTMGTPTGGSQTYTSRVSNAPAGFHPSCQIFTAEVASSPGAMTVSVTPTGSAWHTMCVERWTAARLAVSPAVGSFDDTSGAANTSLTSTGVGSVVSWVAADAQSQDPATRAYLSAAIEENVEDGHAGADGVHYYAWQNAAAPGSQAFGLTLPINMKYVIGGIEILDVPVTWTYGYDVRIG